LAQKKVAHQQPNKIGHFVRETVGELRKVNWPTRQEAYNLTTIVLIVIFIMATFLGFLDILFARLFSLLLNIG
jgi:preprotein translocase subunit SecE